jgi:hypothetical protein
MEPDSGVRVILMYIGRAPLAVVLCVVDPPSVSRACTTIFPSGRAMTA